MPSSSEVDAWFAKYDNPMKPVVQRVREIILAADPRISECIKWQSPTFTFGGNLASFNPRSKQHASLMFHTGAEIRGHFPRLEGNGDVARFMKLGSVEAANAAREELEAIVRAWCSLKAGHAHVTGDGSVGRGPVSRHSPRTISNRPAKRSSIAPAAMTPARPSKKGKGDARRPGR